MTVEVARGLIERAPAMLARWGGRHFVVSDANVWPAHGHKLGPAHHVHLATVGEAAKNWAGLQALVEDWLRAGLRRDDLVVALGGGAVSDLAGFAASMALRGVRWVAIPSTLNAQADAAVGGKTGINVAGVKNWAGAFHPAETVLIDPDLLATLPAPELRAGYAEVAKCGLAGDPTLWRWCEDHGAGAVAGDVGLLEQAVRAAVRFKRELVRRDERDRGERRLLNLGHSFGHAIEAATGMRHGEAVAAGCCLAFGLSADMGLCAEAEAAAVRRHFAGIGLPTSTAIDPAGLVARMTTDKKNGREGLTLVLARGIGRAFVAEGVPPGLVHRFLSRLP